MSQALKLWLTPHQIVEQTGSRLAATLAKIDFTGCRRIGQLFGHHRRHDLRASQIERPCELGEPRAFSDHDAEARQPSTDACPGGEACVRTCRPRGSTRREKHKKNTN